ncbi:MULTISPECIES: N-acyl-D-amino-acid deacylase family protein [Bradyrhizobium]|uniref:D-aminoacylase n=2 Tax=Bradyrhizobium quebecense TaxID=2748629 RepID=A0ABS3MGF0_9BRAD|nr:MULTISPECIES: D-aminoacylase [Bradyrhizobium]UFX46467.1 D-aminoacylase [Bradyrhizobium sp. 41S5]UGY05717.1 D-aminoacylase [Bradyrhizobium quebecense]
MATSETTCDLVFREATVIDGSGAPRFVADVAVKSDRIVAIGDLAGVAAREVVEARGRVLAPGFIDTHSHDDNAVLATPGMEIKVSQGVTSVVNGNCGVSLAPLVVDSLPPPPVSTLGEAKDFAFPTMAAYLDRLMAWPPAVNTASLVGHSTLRVGAMRDLNREANADELAVMRERLREAMAAGAIGFSSGVFYPPSQAATIAETTELARVAAEAGGIYTSHVRDETDGVVTSLQEAITVGSVAGAPVVISHHKVAGMKNFGRSRETLALLDKANETHEVGFDAYPYTAASSWLTPDYLSLCSRVTVTWSKPFPEMKGRDIAAIAREWGCDDKEAASRLQPGGAVYFLMDEADVRRVVSHHRAMIGSDGLPNDMHPHPRLWGTFPRVLGHYVRDEKLFDLEEAVRRMTGLPAATFGFADRGAVKCGAFADLVLFDPDTVIDAATFEQPVQTAHGIELVLVNGVPVWRDGASTGARPGRVLRRQSMRAA